MKEEKYNLRGVSASKEDVHEAIKNIDKGLFPKAFCKVVPDTLTGSDEHCIVMHADGAGTKSSFAKIEQIRISTKLSHRFFSAETVSHSFLPRKIPYLFGIILMYYRKNDKKKPSYRSKNLLSHYLSP